MSGGATSASALLGGNGSVDAACEHDPLPLFYNSSPDDASWQWAATLWTGVLASTVSLAASLVILASYCFLPKFRNTNYRYITAIAFCDACVSVAHLAMTGGMEGVLFQTGQTFARSNATAATGGGGGDDPGFNVRSTSGGSEGLSGICASTLCYATAVVQQYFHLAEYLWISGLALTIYLTLARNTTVDRTFERAMHGTIWGLSALVAVVPAATSCYGSSGHWCWVKSSGSCYDVQWASLYGWLFLLYAFNFFCFVAAEIAICRNPVMRSISGRLRLYLLVFIVINLPTLVHLVVIVAAPGTVYFPLFWLMGLTEPLKGLVNALIFGCNANTLRVYREAFCQREDGANSHRVKTVSELVSMDGRRGAATGASKLLARLRQAEFDDDEDAGLREQDYAYAKNGDGRRHSGSGGGGEGGGRTTQPRVHKGMWRPMMPPRAECSGETSGCAGGASPRGSRLDRFASDEGDSGRGGESPSDAGGLYSAMTPDTAELDAYSEYRGQQ